MTQTAINYIIIQIGPCILPFTTVNKLKAVGWKTHPDIGFVQQLKNASRQTSSSRIPFLCKFRRDSLKYPECRVHYSSVWKSADTTTVNANGVPVHAKPTETDRRSEFPETSLQSNITSEEKLLVGPAAYPLEPKLVSICPSPGCACSLDGLRAGRWTSCRVTERLCGLVGRRAPSPPG